MKYIIRALIILVISYSTPFSNLTISQNVTKISGRVIDKQTKLALPFVNISFKDSYTGTSTDLDGKFELETRFPTDSLIASYVGYRDQVLAVKFEVKQELFFELQSSSLNLETVTVQAKKVKYSKKNNPAVELIKKVMANKQQNRLKGQAYYSYDKYEKIELDLNNITNQFMDRNIFRPFKFIFDYVDTSEINGKPFLPLFLKEAYSKVYYRQSPKSLKEYVYGVKMTEFDEAIDEQSVEDVVDLLYHDIDIYDNTVKLLSNEFLSPLAPLATTFYRFYIIDTLEFKGDSVIELAFIPRNKANFGFTGNMYVSNDDQYSIRKVDLGIIGGINLNFVRDLRIIQEFEPMNDAFILTKDQLTIDYSISQNGIGAFGTRSVNYANYSFSPPEDADVFGGLENTIIHEEAYKRTDDFWKINRMESLNSNESGLYEMVDSLRNLRAYKNLVTGIKIVSTGFIPAGKFDIGPIATFPSFNDVEGFRLRFGGESNFDLSKRLFLSAYGAYGFKDKAFKYAGEMRYSFNEDFRVNPRKFIGWGYSKETSFPGQQLQFINEDNFLLSFRRGVADKMLLSDTYFLQYVNEGTSFDFDIGIEHKKHMPYGNLSFPFFGLDGQEFKDYLETTEIGIGFRMAPNEQFVQGRNYRTPLFNEFPVITLKYKRGVDDFLGGEYNYHKLYASLFKRFYLSVFGITNLEIEAMKIWGENIPYFLLHLPRANQTYAYQIRSFNMMNFMEFASDQYISLNMQHFFQGFIFNRIPLFKKLKLREVITLKMIYGSLSDANNPNLHPSQIQFLKNEDGSPTTIKFGSSPYIEGSFGFLNIFRIFRVDFVKRFSYVDQPYVPKLFGVKGLGIRMRFKVEF